MPGTRRVWVITDSTADLPPDLIAQWGIQVVPLYVHFGEETFRDGVDLSSEAFYARLRGGEFPTTSQPSIGAFRRVYEQAVAGGGEAVSIHLSAKLSGTCEAAMLAADQVDGRVVVVDSEQFSMGLGWLVLAAAEMARAGCSLDEIVARVEEMKKRTYVLALVESLEHLRRGGRIGRAQLALGSLLDIRPIVGLKDGMTILVERVRTRRAGIRRLVELVAAAGPLECLAALHAGDPEAGRQLADDLSPVFPRREIPLLVGGQVTGAHLGPGAVGVAYVVAPPGRAG